MLTNLNYSNVENVEKDSYFLDDTPIRSEKEDLLNRSNFVKNMVNGIIKYNYKESLTIGLIGKWGHGKSSLLNLFVKEIEKVNKEQKSETIIIRFNPWLFSQENDLYSSFFNLLMQELNNNKKSSLKKNLYKYKNLLKSSMNVFLGTVENLTKIHLTSISDILFPNKSLNKLKEDINNELESSNSKIIVLIDDIDRLVDSQIIEIFQLVHVVADFYNIVYILSFDKEVVVNALNYAQKDKIQRSGEDYLNKIIQVPIEIPSIDKQDIKTLFYKYLKELNFNNLNSNNINYKFFNLYFKSIRDLKRYFNLLKFYLPPIENEVDPYDFMKITLIQLFESKLYYNIRNNKEYLTGDSFFTKSEGDKDNSDTYNQILNDINIPKSEIIPFMVNLFPRTRSIYYGTGNVSFSMDIYDSKKSICSYKYFDNYFRYGLFKTDVPQETIDEIISISSDENNLNDKLMELKDNDNFVKLIDKLKDNIPKITEEQIKNILQVLLKNANVYESKLNLNEIIYKLLENIKNESVRFNILHKIIKETKKFNYTIMVVINHEYLKKKKELTGFFTNNHLDILENDVSNVILNYWIKDENFMNYEKIRDILVLWSHFTKNKNNEYIIQFMDHILEDDNLLVKFILLFYERNHVESSNNFRYLNDFIEDKYYIKERINKMDLDSMNFDNNEQRIIDIYLKEG